MRNYFFIIFLFIAGIVNGQSKEYHGTIKRKKGKTPVPGASVILKGTNMGVVTDKNGNFKIVVPDSIRTLIIHAVSFTPTELSVGDQDFLDIYLDSEICYVDWFDAKSIRVSLLNGMINNPVGLQFNFAFPDYFLDPLIKTSINYQTDLNQNRILNTRLGLYHLFVGCYFNADIYATYQNIDYDKRIDLSTISLETNLNFNKIRFITGLNRIVYRDTEKNRNTNSPGFTLGFGKGIRGRSLIYIDAKTSIYKDISEYQVEINKRFDRKNYAFLKYYKVRDFNEVSFGVGIEFTYGTGRKGSSAYVVD